MPLFPIPLDWLFDAAVRITEKINTDLLLAFVSLLVWTRNPPGKDPDDFSQLEIQPSDGPQAPFVDLGSRFTIWQDQRPQEIGPDHASLASQRTGKLSYINPLLHLQVFDKAEGRALKTEDKKTSWYPWGFVQEAEAEGLNVRVTVTYADVDVISVHVDIENAGTSNRYLQLSFSEQPESYPSTRTPKMENLNGTIVVYQVSDPTDTQYSLRSEPPFVIVTAIQPRFELTNGHWDGRYQGTSHDFELPQNANQSFSFLISAAARELERPFLLEDRTSEAEQLVLHRISLIENLSSTLIMMAQQRWNTLLSRLPAIPKDWKEPEKRLFYHAVMTLLRNTIRPQPEQGYGSSYGPYSITFPSRGFYEAGWIWDSAFHAMAFAQLGLIDYAKSNLRAMFHGQDEKTGAVFFKHPDSMVEGAQPPFFSWAVYQVYHQDPDRAFLEEFYPKLKAWSNWWYANRLRTVIRNGQRTELFGWNGGLESGWDNSPRWDNVDVRRLVSPDLNAELLMDLRALQWMAGELGRPEEVRAWREQAETLSRNMVQGLYDSEDGLFYDVHIDDGSFHRVKTPACFLPLWAGVPLDTARVKQMIEGWLLNAEAFFGKYPFPTVAYNEATYTPRFYWRGPVWLNLAYFMTDILYQYGYSDEAMAARDRLLNMVIDKDHIYEYYNSKTGKRGEGPADAIPEIPATQDFSWSAAFVLMMMQKKFGVFSVPHGTDQAT